MSEVTKLSSYQSQFIDDTKETSFGDDDIVEDTNDDNANNLAPTSTNDAFRRRYNLASLGAGVFFLLLGASLFSKRPKITLSSPAIPVMSASFGDACDFYYHDDDYASGDGISQSGDPRTYIFDRNDKYAGFLVSQYGDSAVYDGNDDVVGYTRFTQGDIYVYDQNHNLVGYATSKHGEAYVYDQDDNLVGHGKCSDTRGTGGVILLLLN